MHFILISKKECFKDEYINQDLLNSSTAPSLISRETVKMEISNFIVYVYPYDHIDHEVRDYSYYNDADRLLICNGLVYINNSQRDRDICKFFDNNTNSTYFGDYQLISIDKDGNGFFKTPPLSLRQLFYYEDENCQVLATEIKLIVDGIQKFREKTFVHHFDIDFMEDSIFREWKPRKFPKNTIFKEIKRIFPQDIKYFNEGRIIIEINSIDVPEWFINAFNKDKNGLYDDYYKFLLDTTEKSLVSLKPNIKNIIIGLTGGFDSRLNAAILSKICKKHHIPLISYTAGHDNHPDVILAKKVAKILNIPHFHHTPPNKDFSNTKSYNDYALTFYLAQGDWNSKDYIPKYYREMSSRLSPLIDSKVEPAIGAFPVNESEIYQIGFDGYKRYNQNKIDSGCRWFARRVISHQNFVFPLFFTEYEMWFALLYGEEGKETYKEFVYEILKRSEPKLLDISFVGDLLPQTDIDTYLTEIDSKHHDKEPFLWDYNFVSEKLKPILKKKFDELTKNEKSIIKLVGLNELDYFLNENINRILELYNKNRINLKECFKRLLKEKFSGKYPRNKTMLKLTKARDAYITKTQILMDFAVVADKKSFEEIEKYALENVN